MKTPHISSGPRRISIPLSVALLLVGAPSSHAQAVAPSRAPATAKTEAIILSPFEVVSDANDGYDATNTNSLTGTNASLQETPVDARIMTKQMITELGGGDVFKLLGDFGGLGATLFGGGNEDQRGMQEGDGVQPEGMTGRGFAIGTPRRDGFLRSATSMMNSFDVESADVINGSNNLLYGSGDASGVVVVNSKRAALNRRTGTLSAKFDSEGSTLYTLDANYGVKRLGVRVNLMKSADRYYRPLLGLDQEGMQVSAAYRPVPWVNLYADFRHYTRGAAISSGATLRVPVASGLLLSNGVNLDNQSTNYLIGLGGPALLNNLVTVTNADSLMGAMNRQHWVNKSNSVTMDLVRWKNVAFQARYGRDTRVNATIQPTSTTFFSPDHPSNNYRDAAGNRIAEWATNVGIQSFPYITGAQGLRVTGVAKLDFGQWLGNHRLSGFYSDQRNWTTIRFARFYEVDANGDWVTNRALITNADSGRNQMPSEWRPIFSGSLPYGLSDWPVEYINHPNGKRYRFGTGAYPGAVTPTASNPFGVSGPLTADGRPNQSSYQIDETRENGFGSSLASKFWKNRIDVLVSYRRETAEQERLTTAELKGPITYDSLAYGIVVNTPIKGLRAYANRSQNSKINFATDRDIYNVILPIGSGRSFDGGLKMAMWDHRVSGSITYYKTEQLNNTAGLGGFRNDVDPDGINGRNGGQGYVFSRASDGLSVAMSVRPLKSWQVTLSFTQSNGSERSDVTLPIFYNDQFNTTTVGGQQVVATRTGTGLTPLLVASDPTDATSAQIPLSIAMLKDPTSPYFANLDPDSGQILNSQFLGMRAAGVGTGATGLPITQHQLGFVPPVPDIIVRRSGEPTTGYAENSWSMINRYQFNDGRLRGLVLGLSSIYQQKFRAYRFTDAAAANTRKTFYYPDRVQHNFFGVYGFKGFAKTRMSVQLNVDNLLDKQVLLALPRGTNGVVRYFRQQYTPRKSSLSVNVMF
ncbi:MAG: TonB-dependent receptor [Opitutaceae bacterium]|nr:TonB-dependent receptor [Opitutaceae bacterium]